MSLPLQRQVRICLTAPLGVFDHDPAGLRSARHQNDEITRSPRLKQEKWVGGDPAGCCQTNANQFQFAPQPRISGRAELTPLGESGGAVELEVVA
jgi:hypothetical protein